MRLPKTRAGTPAPQCGTGDLARQKCRKRPGNWPNSGSTPSAGSGGGVCASPKRGRGRPRHNVGRATSPVRNAENGLEIGQTPVARLRRARGEAYAPPQNAGGDARATMWDGRPRPSEMPKTAWKLAKLR